MSARYESKFSPQTSRFLHNLLRFATRLLNDPRTSKSTRKYTQKNTTHSTSIPRQSQSLIQPMCQECVESRPTPLNPKQPHPNQTLVVLEYRSYGISPMPHPDPTVSRSLATSVRVILKECSYRI